MTVRAIVANEIEIAVDEIPAEAVALIKSALTIANESRARAVKEGAWGAADEPETYALWRESGHSLILPRGFAQQLKDGLKDGFGIDDVEFEHNLSDPISDVLRAAPAIRLFDDQVPVVDALERNHWGYIEIPTGGGKTIDLLELIRRAGMRALVIVDRGQLAEQWRERAVEHLGVSAGFIGEGMYEEHDLTIALRQSLHSNLWHLVARGWFQRWGTVVIDEIQHLTAPTLQEIVRHCTSQRLIGASATPAQTETRRTVLRALFGYRIHEVTKRELVAAGRLVKASVNVVNTNFDFPFHPTMRVSSLEDCPVHGCKKEGTVHGHRNNYQAMLSKLVSDRARNKLIASRILRDGSRHQLVVSRYLKHFDAIASELNMLDDNVAVYRLSGKESPSERDRVIEDFSSYGGVLFSTIADEGFDMPALSRIHMVFPQRSHDGVTQKIGRVERTHPNKSDAIVYDYSDIYVGVLRGQFNQRRQVYSRDAMQVIIEA